MADIFTPEKRSWVMSRIRSKDTKIEKKIASLLRKNKIRYRRFPKVFGSPDFVVEKKVLVFCDGDFWHGRDWEQRRAKLADGANPDYWINKIASNRERALHQSQELEAAGWLVLRFWESELLSDVEAIADGVARAVRLDRS